MANKPVRASELKTPRRDPPRNHPPKNNHEGEWVAGINPVAEALEARPGGCIELVIARGRHPARVERIVELAREAGVKVRFEERHILDRMAGKDLHHQGVLARFGPKGYVELEDLLPKALEKRPALIVVLDEIMDPQNLGAVARSAEAAGAAGLIVAKDRAAPLTAAAGRASAGALEHLPVARVTNLVRALEACKEAGFWVAGTVLEGGQELYAADLTVDLALVIGREDKGMRREVAKTCDLLLTIPMRGKVQSLNAAAAAAVVLFEALRQRTRKT